MQFPVKEKWKQNEMQGMTYKRIKNAFLIIQQKQQFKYHGLNVFCPNDI